MSNQTESMSNVLYVQGKVCSHVNFSCFFFFFFFFNFAFILKTKRKKKIQPKAALVLGLWVMPSDKQNTHILELSWTAEGKEEAH